MFRTGEARIDGTMQTRSYVADSGNTVTQWFCPACGTPIYAQSAARTHLRTVRIGVLDQPHGLRPRMVIWTEQAPAWAVIDPALERHARQPPAPAAPAASAPADPPARGLSQTAVSPESASAATRRT
jgi:hypothetical protein